MAVGFFRRLTSALVDFILVMLVVYLAYVLAGRTILQNRVDYFDQRYSTYSQILTAYNDDVHDLQVEYEANLTVADGDAELEAAAADTYNAKLALLDLQNSIDIEPYNESLTGYFVEIIYFFSIGFLLIITLVSVLMLGKTPGRRAMQIRLVSTGTGEMKEPNSIQVFFHDIVLRYFFVALVFTISLYYGFLLILLTLIVDMIFMTVTRNKTTLRDYFLRMQVVKTGAGF